MLELQVFSKYIKWGISIISMVVLFSFVGPTEVFGCTRMGERCEVNGQSGQCRSSGQGTFRCIADERDEDGNRASESSQSEIRTEDRGNLSTQGNNQNPTPGRSSVELNQGTEGEGGLIQCGYSRDCTLCDLFILIRDVFNFILGLLGMIGVISIVIGGVYMVLSSGNPSMYQQGVQIIINAVLGLILASSSFLIFGFGLQALGFQEQNFAAVFTFESGSFFEIQCDNAAAFNDRGGWGRGVSLPGSSGGGGGASVQCQNNTCLANNPGLKEAIDNNKAGIEGNILLALVDAGEGCNPAIRTTCNTSGFSHNDCSCGFSQCTPRWRAEVTGISDPRASCEALRNDIQLDIDCAAHAVQQTNALGDRNGRRNACTDIQSIASCYNTGSATACGQATNNYCGRVESFYQSC